MITYQNTSNEMKRWHDSQGTWQIVAPGDVFDSDIEQTHPAFKLVPPNAFKSADQIDEKIEIKKVKK